MKPPSARVQGDTVTIQATAFVPDPDGGRVLVPVGEPSDPIACKVSSSSTKDRPHHLREEGVTYLTLNFTGDEPDVRVRYLINWTGPSFATAKVLNVLNPPRPADATTWCVDCEYRVPPRPGLA